MPKRNRDSDKEQISIKEEPGTASDADAPEDLQEMKEMLRATLDREATLTVEKAEIAAEKAEMEAQRTIEQVHRVFESNRHAEGWMQCAQLVQNPNLLNVFKNGGKELDWTQEHHANNGDIPEYSWFYIAVRSWTEVLWYFENGVGEELDFKVYRTPDLDALANIVVCGNDNGDEENDALVVGALTYRCSKKFHQYLYKEKYKTETEELWPRPVERRDLGQNLCLEGNVDVPESLYPAIAAQPFDATIRNVFLPTDSAETSGARFDLYMDKMVAVRRGGDGHNNIFSQKYRYDSYLEDTKLSALRSTLD